MHVLQATFIGGLIAQQASFATVIPTFHIDLDLPPEERWTEVITHYSDEIVALENTLNQSIHAALGDQYEAWYNLVSIEKEYEAEMRGMAKTQMRLKPNQYNISLEDKIRQMVLGEALYELASPTGSMCSGVLWAASNGTVMHGRNMDYSVEFEMPDGTKKNWVDVTYHAIFMKDKQPFIKATMWPGSVGFHTAMRIGGWSFEQNTRMTNEVHANFEAQKKGGVQFGTAVRRVMETTPDFTTAVDKIYATRFIAPQYFIMSGSKPYEGAVLTIDRLGQHASMPETPPIQRVGNTSSAAWNLVQTNDDLLKEPLDPRRPLANMELAKIKQEFASPEHLLDFMHKLPLDNPLTVFSTVMVPATGFYTSILHNESAPGATSILETKATVQPRRHRKRTRARFLGPATESDHDYASMLQLSAHYVEL